jgi:Flp pilus assembly protein TadD
MKPAPKENAPEPTPARPAPARPSDDEKAAQALLAEGATLNATGSFQAAADRFRASLALVPKDVRAQYDLGVALENAKDWKGAATAYDRTLALDSSLAFVRVDLAQVKLALGDAPGARRDLETANAQDPKLGAAWIALASLDFADGKLDDALRTLESAARYATDDAEVHYHLGLVREARGDTKGAVAAFERAIELEPRHASALNELAILLELQGTTQDRPLELWKKAIDANPLHAEAEKNLGATLYKRRQQGYVALSHLERYAKLSGRDKRVLQWIAEIKDASKSYRTDDRAFAIFDRFEDGKVFVADGAFPLKNAQVAERARAERKGDRVRVIFESNTSAVVVAVDPR